MTNFDYYVKGGRFREGWSDFVVNYYNKIKTGKAMDRYNEWLLNEHKEPILDDVEREYLSNVIKPFRDKVSCITKDVNYKTARIRIAYRDGSSTCLPWFPKEKMYVNMLRNTYYSLEELGL